METRSDHATEAKRITDYVTEAIAPTKERNDTPNDVMTLINRNAMRELATAQIHATLAVAEQQHIANLQRERDVLAEKCRNASHGEIADKQYQQFRTVERLIEEALGLDRD